jgi:HSP20 family molecular chaperone IbpA
LVGERRAGNFCRKFHLPMSVDAANLRARLEDGLLKIRVDKVRIDQRISGQTQIG